MQKISESYKLNDTWIGFEFGINEQQVITIQQANGEILFSGSKEQLDAVVAAAEEITKQKQK